MSGGDSSGERFTIREQLGSGAMGVVMRVLDRQRGEDVALKSLQQVGPDALYRFKREFRELRDLVHPNLVTLFELFSVDSDWMFTMELVQGVTFTQWVDGDAARLRPALVQLADGILALHAAGKLHRDLKPSNVLVDGRGRVVILDFGLVTQLTRTDVTRPGVAVGTPRYMSPEQGAGAPLTAASDWYAVGVMLYRCLTGRPPFEGASHDVMIEKLRLDPPTPRSLEPACPADLDELCTALLSRDPSARPDGRAVLAALGAAPSEATDRIAAAHRPQAITRNAAALEALRAALAASREHPVLARLSGPRGSGKSAVLDAFRDEVNAAGGLAIAVRIDVREYGVPYQGADNLIDELVRHLSTRRRRDVAAILPKDLDALVRMFPSFRRLRAADIPMLLSADTPADVLRARVTVAFGELLGNLAREGPLALLVDDVHFGRDQGVQEWLEHFSRPDAPRCLQVYAYSSEHADLPMVKNYGTWTGDLRDIELAGAGSSDD
ncbi:MAG TPA: serine/threonine-protein kinase [Kofleriaceae bacterium]|nr:serine/threonine-protein kinase [Kofleriaceae bacterium]